jgi:hypothetical protein
VCSCQDRDEIRSNKVTQAAALLDSYNELNFQLLRTEEAVAGACGLYPTAAAAEDDETYECFYSHGKALIAVRRLRVITIAVNCGHASSIQGIIRGLQPTNHAIMTLRSLLLSPVPGDLSDDGDQVPSYNNTNTSTSPLCNWLLRNRRELAHSAIAAGVGEAHLQMITSCPVFLHLSALLGSYTLILFEEFNAESRKKAMGATKDSSLQHTSTIESLLNEVLQAPQIQLLLHLMHGMQDALASCVKTLAYRSAPQVQAVETGDEEELAEELLELLGSSDQFAHLLSLVHSCNPFMLGKLPVMV